MKFSLDRPHAQRYADEKILDELRRVAGIYQNQRFSRRDFDKRAEYCKGSVVLARFGSWQAALDAAGMKLTVVQKDRHFISNDELFAEMEAVWHRVGHRPSKNDWEFQKPKYNYSTYKARFGGWVNACAAFIEHISENGRAVTQIAAPAETTSTRVTPKGEDNRGVPIKLRYRILTRDNYRCVLCGRSPALELGVRLHIDHVIPFSRGGKTSEQNLRTLCESCNWGKADDNP